MTATAAPERFASSLASEDIQRALGKLARGKDAKILVGQDPLDGVVVRRATATTAMVTGAVALAPMVDDPFAYGQIAAATALGRIYALGAQPATALGLVAAPSKKVPPEALLRILQGIEERLRAAGVYFAGAQPIPGDEPVCGLSVGATAHPRKIVRRGGAKPGDALVLTKPLGTGIVCSGIRKRLARIEEVAFATASMVALNDVAGSLLGRFRARASTDVAGLGLAGHAAEMVAASGAVRFEIDAAQLPLLPGSARLAEDGYVTQAAGQARQRYRRRLRLGRDLAPALAEAVLDPQVSGGLLVALSVADAESYVEALHDRGLRPALVGRVTRRPAKAAVVVTVE